MRFLFFLVFSCITFSSCQSQETHQCPFRFNHSSEDLCGFVEVPRDRKSNSKDITQIAYLVIKSQSENRKPDPVIFLQGGPGGDVLKQANSYSRLALDSDRDFIMYDQRGIGFSEELCPDLNLELIKILSRDLTIASETEALQKQIIPCKDYIKTDNRQFSTTTNVYDLEALRKHLGYTQLNLFGGSYGTRLGLKYMELYPKRVRSAILSSLFPQEIRMYNNLYSNFESAFNKVFETCKLDSNCNTKYPNLKAEFLEAYQKIKTNPIDLSEGNSAFILNQQDALLFIHQMLYSPITIGDIPSFIRNLKVRNTEAIRTTVNKYIPRLTIINLAVYYAVMTSDEGEFNNEQLLKNDSDSLLFLDNSLSLFSADPEVIASWPIKNPASSAMKPVNSDVPTLLVSGDFDPITPPKNGTITSKTLRKSQHIIFNNSGHVPINYCFMRLAKTFLDHPDKELINDCSRSTKAINWD